MGRTIARMYLLLGIGTASACSSQPVDIGLKPSVAIVYGVVLDEAQEPVPGATVAIEAFEESCEAGDLFASEQVATDSTGSYRSILRGPHVSEAETCVVLGVAPTDAYGGTTQSGATVRFVHEPMTPPIDSVRVDVAVASH